MQEVWNMLEYFQFFLCLSTQKVAEKNYLQSNNFISKCDFPMFLSDSWTVPQPQKIKMSPICDQISPFVFLCVEFLFPIVVLLLSSRHFIWNILLFLLSGLYMV